NKKPASGDEDPKKTKSGDEPEEKKPTKEERDQAWEKGKQEGKKKVKEFVEAMKSGDPEAKKQAALEFLKDKNAMMELNRDPGMGRVRAELNKTLKDVYGHVDKKVIGDLANDPYYKDKGLTADDFRILNPTNPKKPTGTTKSSYDRDITVQRRAQAGEWIPDPNAPSGFRQCKSGETAWIDVPAKDLESTYSKRFYEAATGKPAPDAETARQFTRDHDQTCTDRQSNDSYGRFNKDLKTAMSQPGRKFTDPEQVGQAMGYKAHEWFEKADHARSKNPAQAEGYMAEGMRQTSKQWDNQAMKRVDALKQQGVEVRVPQKLNEAMGELKKVEAGQISPAQAEANLKKLGFDSPHQVAYESGKYVESLDKLRPKIPPKK
ncbi:MAG: hypothetical protein MUC42_16030, partial [Bryobacter sp.]|nr:hypothetical protein [Bryobacter sp.]